MRRTQTAAPVGRPTWGARWMLYGAVALILVSGCAAYMQIDTSRVWLDALIHANRKMGVSIWPQLGYMLERDDFRRLFAQMLFLLGMVIFGVVVLRLRKRTVACAVLIPVCAGCFWGGLNLGLYSLQWTDWWRLAYAAPYPVIVFGCLLQLIHRAALVNGATHPAAKHQRRRQRRPPPVRRTAPEPQRQFFGAPGATRTLPNAVPPQQPVRTPTVRTPQRLEKVVPDPDQSHIGPVPAGQEPPPRYQWRTIRKQDDDRHVIHQ